MVIFYTYRSVQKSCNDEIKHNCWNYPVMKLRVVPNSQLVNSACCQFTRGCGGHCGDRRRIFTGLLFKQHWDKHNSLLYITHIYYLHSVLYSDNIIMKICLLRVVSMQLLDCFILCVIFHTFRAATDDYFRSRLIYRLFYRLIDELFCL